MEWVVIKDEINKTAKILLILKYSYCFMLKFPSTSKRNEDSYSTNKKKIRPILLQKEKEI